MSCWRLYSGLKTLSTITALAVASIDPITSVLRLDPEAGRKDLLNILLLTATARQEHSPPSPHDLHAILLPSEYTL